MKRDPLTRAPDFYRFARDYLHTYLSTVARRSPIAPTSALTTSTGRI